MDYVYNNLSQKSNLNQIHRDVASSSMIDKDIIYCVWHEGNLVVRFQNSLDTSDKSILDSIVNSAFGNESDLYFKITNSPKSPVKFNINHFGLYKEEIINSLGLLVEVNYYSNYDIQSDTYSNLVVKDYFEYTIDSNDLVTSRVETITWYLNNGQVGEKKIINKYYKLNDAIKEGKARRGNLVDKAKTYGFTNISGEYSAGLPNSHHLFDQLRDNVDKYIKGVKKQDLIDQIDNSNESYLTQSIKDGLTGILKYWE